MSTAATMNGHQKGYEYPAHQFDSIPQQRQSVTLGMWVFLVQEIMFFGGIFFSYVVYRYFYPEAFHDMSHHLDVTLGTLNTGFLLTSSLTMALAVNAAQKGNKNRLVGMLLVTFLLACAFLVVKYFEYSAKFHHGLVPGSLWDPHGFDAQMKGAQIFFSFYFATTGLHAFHVLIGVILIAFYGWRAHRGHYPQERYQVIEMLGLYWHFVDLVWIYVFPLFYLIGRT